MTLRSFLRILTQQVRKHGRHGLQAIERPRELRTGFKTPDGEWLIGINVIKAAFSDDQWMENTAVKEAYAKAGGKTPIVALTRTPPIEVLVILYRQALDEAVRRGERLRSLA